MTDGIYLMQWRWPGALAVPLAASLGFLAPILHDGPSITTSRLAMALVAAAGTFGVALGASVTLGYLVGYYLWGEPVTTFSPTLVERWLGAPGAFIQAVLLVWLLSAAAGMTTLAIRVDLRARGWEQRLGLTVARIVNLATVGSVMYFITKAMPILVRPIYVWKGDSPRSEAVVPIQTDWWIVVVAALGATMVRLALERRATGETVVQSVVDVSRNLAKHADAGLGFVSPRAKFLGTAALISFVIGPLFETFIQALVVFVVVVVLLVGRQTLARRRTVQALVAVPLVARYGVAIVVSWFATDLILGFRASNDRFQTDSFSIGLVAVVTSLAIFMVVTAPVDAKMSTTAEQKAGAAS